MDELRGRAPAVTAGINERRVLLGVVVAGLIWSSIGPPNRLYWMAEVSWALVALPWLIRTRDSFPLTRLMYWLIAAYALILIYGAKYSYSHTPLGEMAREAFDFSRNHYDRLGHFTQGFVPAILARELLLRCTPLRPGGWVFYLVCAACLSASALFEFLEWGTALISRGTPNVALAMQGDVWDTHWDMFLALLGSILSQLIFARVHDRHLGIASR